jgi:hypothetical protein
MFILINPVNENYIPYRVTDGQHSNMSVHIQSLYQQEDDAVLDNSNTTDEALTAEMLLGTALLEGNEQPNENTQAPDPQFQGFEDGQSGGAGATGEWGAPQDDSSKDGEAMQADNN